MIARPLFCLLLAQTRYFTSCSRVVNAQISLWESRARAIPDPELSALALRKLRNESSHAAAATMLATSVPRSSRHAVASAIVALEVLYDYLDGRTENLPSSSGPLLEGSRLFAPFTEAFALSSAPPNGAGGEGEDASYMAELSRTVSDAFAQLPSAHAVAPIAQVVALRAAQAQIRMHAAPALGIGQLTSWAATELQDPAADWRKCVVSSASSVLVLHALLAAAADPSTSAEDAPRIAEAYSSICVLLTLLDGIVDYELDDGRLGYIGLYSTARDVQDAMVSAARRASVLASALPNPAFHSMLLSGVFAYYASSAGASNAFARPIISSVREEVGPLATPALVTLRSWRAARRRFRDSRAHETSSPEPSWSPRERSELS